jgi:4,5-DOPA dioxygenase extradiol
MTTDPLRVLELSQHADFRAAVPTPDHFIPLLYLAGMAGVSGTGADVLVDGYAYGSLSMTSYTLGVELPRIDATAAGTPALPRDVPADDTNL